MSDPLAFLDDLDETEEELGFLDVEDDLLQGFSNASEMLETLTDAMNRMTTEIEEQAEELTTASAKDSPKVRRKILSKSSASMDTFVETCRAVLPLMQGHLADGIDGARKLVIMLPDDIDTLVVPRAEMRGSLASLNKSMRTSFGQFQNLSETLSTLPRASKEFNLARRRTKAVIDGISSLTLSASREVDEIIKTLE